MTFKEIQELIKLVNKTNLSELKLKDGEFEISLRSKDFFRNKSVSYEGAPIMSVAPTAVPAPAPTSAAPVAPAASTVSTEKPAEKNVEPASSSKTIEIKSPIVGTFYRSSSPDKPPFMKVGDDVKAGDVVCIVEAMKLFNEIESEVSGKIVKVMIEDATPVEYDQVLFLVEPA